MLKSLRVKNFLCFKDLSVDLQGPKEGAIPYALIYGENGSGKTNILHALRFLKVSLNSYQASKADAHSIGYDQKKIGFTMSTLYSEYSRIGSDEPIELSYCFRINGKDADYSLVIDRSGLIGEKLIYALNGRKATLFSLTGEGRDISKVLKGKYADEIGLKCDKFWGWHSFLSLISDELSGVMPRYTEENIASELLDVIRYIRGMNLYFPHPKQASLNPLMNPKGGQFPSQFDPIMDAMAEAMSDFFCGLYSDVEGVRYLKSSGPDYTKYELVFDKRVEGKKVVIPIGRESSGTQKLVDMFYYILLCVHGDVVLVDEMDSGIHDVLMMEVFKEIDRCLKDQNGQLIATTHNTLLLQNSEPRNTFIIDLDGEGCRSVRTIKDITKTQKTNNNTKRYIEGDFRGIPVVGYMGLREVADEFFSKIEGLHNGL